jgi:ribosome biogenesis GTPase A
VLGRITLETPAEFEQWAAVATVADAERQAKKDALAQSRKKGRKPR